MHAFLYIGQPEEQRTHTIDMAVDALGIASYDRLTLLPTDKPSIGVAETRLFMHQLNLAPHSPNGIAAIIPHADALTMESQQALLKTIEEPPPHVRLFFGAPSETSLVPTIVSRCQIFTLHTDSTTVDEKNLSLYTDAIKELVVLSPGKRIARIGSIGKTKDDAKAWIDNAITACHMIICNEDIEEETAHSHTQIIAILHALLDVKRLTANNVNPFQLLEHVFLTL